MVFIAEFPYGFPLVCHYMPLGLPMVSFGVPTIFHRCFYGFHCAFHRVCLWSFHCLPLAFPQLACGFAMAFHWFSDGVPMVSYDILCICCCFPLVYHWLPYALSCGCLRLAFCFHLIPHGILQFPQWFLYCFLIISLSFFICVALVSMAYTKH